MGEKRTVRLLALVLSLLKGSTVFPAICCFTILPQILVPGRFWAPPCGRYFLSFFDFYFFSTSEENISLFLTFLRQRSAHRPDSQVFLPLALNTTACPKTPPLFFSTYLFRNYKKVGSVLFPFPILVLLAEKTKQRKNRPLFPKKFEKLLP